MIAPTESQTEIVLRIASVYLRIGRPLRALHLLLAIPEGNDPRPRRLAAGANIALGRAGAAQRHLDVLEDLPATPAERAGDLVRTLAVSVALGRPEAGREAFAALLRHCDDHALDPWEFCE